MIGIKERGRRDAIPEIGAVLGAAIRYLAARGDLPASPGIVLSPAPTRRRVARLRGGDTVAAICQASGFDVVPLVYLAASVRDSAGLDAVSRRKNLVGSVRMYRRVEGWPKRVVVIDDVVTTGATAAATVECLSVAGILVTGVVALAAA
ncbi:ComF family protein [Corynebacterium sp. CCM 9185]|uniref:ComF family protein n=1 Tax=Corynebacterium marambiense TaxID=2765364 RepID=UPI001E5BF952|nr:ComF family protein [Corynebacterium marambiense]MCK7662123.1 ComF family protein [Corynebacterium marambiense]MCX7541392.1 ComF family protein [Corynebacterium marambiense]